MQGDREPVSFLLFLCYFIVLICLVVPYTYVQLCAATAVEDQCLVLSFDGLAVWLSSLLAQSLLCFGHLTAAI